MKRFIGIGLIALGVVACGNETNPLTSDPTDEIELELPPGTEGATARSAVQRYEEQDGNGNGYAQSITYDPDANTFHVDNLAFDADNVYQQDDVVSTLGPFRVYENLAVYQDSVTGVPINQFPHKAIFGQSRNLTSDGDPITEFAIVRTGAYADYGFGGFMYQRRQGVTLPASGQAVFAGDYAGLRDFGARGGLEYVTGDMAMAIDFEDFNDGDGVRGQVTNRRILDINGNDITASVTTALGVTALPTLVFTVGPGVGNNAGEMTGEITSSYYNPDGALEGFESGNYYAVLSGEGADMEVAGVIVVTADDKRWDGVTVRETGGFILYR